MLLVYLIERLTGKDYLSRNALGELEWTDEIDRAVWFNSMEQAEDFWLDQNSLKCSVSIVDKEIYIPSFENFLNERESLKALA